MEIKLAQAMSLYGSLESLKSKKLPIKTSYKLNKLFTSLHEQALFYSEQMKSFIQDYAELDSEGKPLVKEDNNYYVPEENRDAYTKKMFELNTLDVKVTDVKFTLDELEGLEVDLSIMNALMPFIEE